MYTRNDITWLPAARRAKGVRECFEKAQGQGSPYPLGKGRQAVPLRLAVDFWVPIFQHTAELPAPLGSALTSLPPFACFHVQSSPQVTGAEWLSGFGCRCAPYLAIHGGAMLKITVLDGGLERRVIVEGKLTEPCVSELEAAWNKARQAGGTRPTVVDLRGVTAIDMKGEAALDSGKPPASQVHVIPAKAGIHCLSGTPWIPAFAGMTWLSRELSWGWDLPAQMKKQIRNFQGEG